MSERRGAALTAASESDSSSTSAATATSPHQYDEARTASSPRSSVHSLRIFPGASAGSAGAAAAAAANAAAAREEAAAEERLSFEQLQRTHSRLNMRRGSVQQLSRGSRALPSKAGAEAK